MKREDESAVLDAIDAAMKTWRSDSERLIGPDSSRIAWVQPTETFILTTVRAALEARGLCVVPREATEAMIETGQDSVGHGHGLNIDGDAGAYIYSEGVRAIWTAMLSASQEQQT